MSALTPIIYLFVLGLAAYMVYRVNPRSWTEAAGKFAAWAVLFILLATAFRAWLPIYYNSTVDNFAHNWGSTLDTTVGPVYQWGASTFTGQSVPAGKVPYGYSDPQPYTQQDPPITYFQEPMAPNQPVLPPAEAGGGGGVTLTGTETIVRQEAPAFVAPTPTITETRKMAEKQVLYQQMYGARQANDRALINQVLQRIIDIDPYDVNAAQMQSELQAADRRVASYQALKRIALQRTKVDTHQQTVQNTLSGGVYEIVDDGHKFATLACNEQSTVVDLTPGLTYGAQFTLPRCYLEPFVKVGMFSGGAKTGQQFEVR